MKPVELYERMMNNSTAPGELVLEPFGGSGTTLIAAAKTGRICRAMEIAPRYCDVIRKRWTKFAKENGKDPGSGALE
jgi:DNA modification methylase